MEEIRRTICNRDCPDVCGIVATVEDGRITKLRGDPSHPVTKGFLCYRTSHFLGTQYSPDRLTSPLLRKNGELEPVSWDEALDFAAERLLAIRASSGPASIFHYRSGGSLGILKAVTDIFFERFGPVTTKRGDICSGAGDAAQLMDFGEEDSNDLFDLLNAKHILVWGKNVVVSSPHTVPVLRDAKARGAELVLIDPVHHRTAGLCDVFYQVKPAGDFALAMAVARILFERGWVDPEAASYCDHLDEFRELAFRRSIEEWCDLADLPVTAAEDLARRLGPGKPTAILVGWGMGRRTTGGAIVRALDALSAVSGNIGISGGGVSFYFKRRGAFATPAPVDGDLIKRTVPRTVCEPLFGEDVLAMRDPPIRAVWVTAGNPVAMLPDSASVVEALRTRELVIVVDSFLTDTARLAHLVLPTTTLLEDDDLLGAYGHHYIGASTPVVPPPPGVKSDLEIIQELARRVGLAAALEGSARDWKRRFLSPKLLEKGVTLETLEEGPTRNPLPPKVLFKDRRFLTESGRVNLITAEPPEPSEPGGGDFPLYFMALSTDKSQSSQWSKPLEGPMVVTVHPDAAGGVPDGALGRIESRVGSMVARIRHDALQRRDVALTPKGGHMKDGRCANAIIRARTTDIGEGGSLYDERVRIVPV
jgi:anaerobic selenocysteine-containing dehydrogenase